MRLHNFSKKHFKITESPIYNKNPVFIPNFSKVIKINRKSDNIGKYTQYFMILRKRKRIREKGSEKYYTYILYIHILCIFSLYTYKLNHCAVYLKLIQHYKPTILQ